MGFNPERRITDAERSTFFEAARWAASSFNEQPWRFIWADRNNAEAWGTMISLLTEYNQRWASTSSMLVLVVASENYEQTGKPNRHAWYDTGMAASNMVTQLTSMGLQAHQMGGFDAEKARVALQLPAGYAPIAMMAIGEPVPVESVAEEFRGRASEARTRKGHETIFFKGQFGTAD
jgi:nitroreductase